MAALVTLIVVTLIGVLLPISQSQAAQEYSQLETELANPTFFSIFINNFGIAILGFIPFVGAIFEGFVLFNTGLAVAVIGATKRVPATYLLAVSMTTPFFWMEYFSYSIAITAAAFLIVSIQQCRFRAEFRYFLLQIALVVGLLLAAALIEMTYVA
jgi:hypothetical protein